MVELPKTEAELQAYVDEKINAATTALKTEYDGKFAAQRKKHDEEIVKIKADAGKSAEELAAQKVKEENEARDKELEDLRSYKKGKVLEERLSQEKLPNHYKYDSRLLNASEEDFEKVLKDVKKEYEAEQPKGNQTSTVVKTGGKEAAKGDQTASDIANEEFAEVLGRIVGK